MKKTVVILAVVALLGIGTLAFANGYGGYYGGHMMSGPGMMGWGTAYTDDTQTKEFLDKTTDIRKELHNKRFDYMEAWRSGDREKAEKLAKEIDELGGKIYAEAPKTRTFGRGAYCW